MLAGVVTLLVQAPPAFLRRPRSACLAVVVTPELLGQLLWFFTKAGAFVFGSGLAIVPFLYGGVVQEYGWLNDKQFLDAVAVAMLTPGPVVITVAFIGYLVASMPGAIAAAIGIFVPVYLFVVIPFPWFDRFSENPQVKAFVGGVTAAASGAIAGACFVLARRAIVDVPTLLIGARRPRHHLALQGAGARADRRGRGGGPHHLCAPRIGDDTMKWITRERARVDRIACPWLITRFVDPAPEFLFVPPGDVMAVAGREHAMPFDVPDVELGHHGPRCSFDAFVERYDLDDPGLVALAEIVRGADTDHRDLTPESAGLYAAATGFQAISRDDHDNMARQFPLYDALYDFCRTRAGTGPSPPRVLFVCLHGAAKSVVAAAHFRALAGAQGLPLAAVAAGTEPDPELTPAAVKGLADDGLIPAPGTAAPGHAPRSAHGDAHRQLRLRRRRRRLGQPVERWDDVPAVSDGYDGARTRIVERVRRLVGDLADNPAR